MNIKECVDQLVSLKEHCGSMVDKDDLKDIWQADVEALQFAIGMLGGKDKNLLELMVENPDLPVIPIVDGEIPGDDSGYWLGAWGIARVDEYLLTKNNEWMVFKSDDDVFDVLERHLSDEEFERLPEDESECRRIYDALPWTKAIIVYINAL